MFIPPNLHVMVKKGHSSPKLQCPYLWKPMHFLLYRRLLTYLHFSFCFLRAASMTANFLSFSSLFLLLTGIGAPVSAASGSLHFQSSSWNERN